MLLTWKNVLNVSHSVIKLVDNLQIFSLKGINIKQFRLTVTIVTNVFVECKSFKNYPEKLAYDG